MIVLTIEEFNNMKKDIMQTIGNVKNSYTILTDSINKEENFVANKDLYKTPISNNIDKLYSNLTKLVFYTSYLDTEYECSSIYRTLARLERANIFELGETDAFEKFEYLELLANMENYMTIADFVMYWQKNLRELSMVVKKVTERLEANLENTEKWLQLV